LFFSVSATAGRMCGGARYNSFLALIWYGTPAGRGFARIISQPNSQATKPRFHPEAWDQLRRAARIASPMFGSQFDTRALLARGIAWKLMNFADFDGMSAVSFEHLSRRLYMLADKRFQLALPSVRHGFSDREVGSAITRKNSQWRACLYAGSDAILAITG
jgi:hypothetical protein